MSTDVLLGEILQSLKRIEGLLAAAPPKPPAGLTRSEIFDVWRARNDAIEKLISNRLNNHLKGVRRRPEEKTAMTYVRKAADEYITGGIWFEDEVPNPQTEAAVERRKAEFDPATFDWSKLLLTSLMRGRLEALLARRRATP